MATRRLDDVSKRFIGWCGVLALLGQGQTGTSPRKRVAIVALGVALLILAHMIDGDRRLAARYHAAVRAGRRFLNRTGLHFVRA